MFGISSKILVASGVVIALLSLGSYALYKSNQKLREKNTLLSVEVDNAKDTILTLETEQTNIIASVNRIQNKFNELDTEVKENQNRVRNTLNEHDLHFLVSKKQELITRIVNRAVRETMSDLEGMSDPSYISTNIIEKVNRESLEKMQNR